MIRNLCFAIALWPVSLWAQTDASAAPPDALTGKESEAQIDTSIQEHRTAFDTLTERVIGKASKPVRFDWRKSTFGLSFNASQLSELNNFGSARVGGAIRFPIGGLMGEVGASRAFTWSTDSTRKLARTPYRQTGRPSRLELDFNLGFPLAEGVVTAWPGFFPATELVFSATAGFRYLLYTDSYDNAGFTDVAKSILAPQLSNKERRSLEKNRPPGMAIDSARYGLLAGFTTDIYFQSGLFLSPRALIAVPLLAPATNTQLYLWWELTMALGWAF